MATTRPLSKPTYSAVLNALAAGDVVPSHDLAALAELQLPADVTLDRELTVDQAWMIVAPSAAMLADRCDSETNWMEKAIRLQVERRRGVRLCDHVHLRYVVWGLGAAADFAAGLGLPALSAADSDEQP